MTTNNIYRINAGVDTNNMTLKSVYIPSIHSDYDVSTICYLFQIMFGIVCRIDRVEKPNPEPVFHSMFVYYYEKNNLSCESAMDQNNRIYPAKWIWNRQALQSSPISPHEFWVILPNKKMFPDTTLTLDEISKGFDRMEADLNGSALVGGSALVADSKELAILSENREYLRELRYAQNTPNCYYLDTSINVHQLAQNLKLMEERYAEKQEKNFRFDIGGTTLFVENIPSDFAEPELWEYFSKLQPGLIGAKVCKNPKTKESMRCGYVCFDIETIAENIVNNIENGFKLSLV